MKNILNLNEKEARNFFLKKDSYVNFDLLFYFSFQELLYKIATKLNGKKLSDYRKQIPGDFDDINYQLLSNKDGQQFTFLLFTE